VTGALKVGAVVPGCAAVAEAPAAADGFAEEAVAATATVAPEATAFVVTAVVSVAGVAVLAEVDSVIGVRAF